MNILEQDVSKILEISDMIESLSDLKVLVVDDDSSLVRFVELILADLTVTQVQTAHDGR